MEKGTTPTVLSALQPRRILMCNYQRQPIALSESGITTANISSLVPAARNLSSQASDKLRAQGSISPKVKEMGWPDWWIWVEARADFVTNGTEVLYLAGVDADKWLLDQWVAKSNDALKWCVSQSPLNVTRTTLRFTIKSGKPARQG